MSIELKKVVAEQFSPPLSAIGFAPVDRFDDAPEKHHPANACKDAQTVIVIGITAGGQSSVDLWKLATHLPSRQGSSQKAL